MNNWTGKKILYMVLSLVVALGIWIFVDNVEGVEVQELVEDIPIEFIGEDTTLADRGLMRMADSDQTISLELSGPRTVLYKLDVSKIRVTADLSNITSTGKQNINYKIQYPKTEFSNSLTVKWASAYYVSVNIGELYSKDVEIRCDIQGNVAEGYIAGKIQYEPGTLEVRGQQELVDQVSYAQLELVIDNATETVTQTLSYQLCDEAGNVLDSEDLHAVTDQIEVTLPVNVIKELPLTMNFIEAPGASLSNVEYSIEPKSVTLSGDAAILKNMNALVLDDFSLENLSNGTKYNYAIPIPDGCENLSGTARATLKIAFRDMASKSVTTTRIEMLNQPEGKAITILSEELTVQLRGTSVDLEAVTPERVIAQADLTDVSAASGSYTVPVAILIETNGDVGILGEYQIKITISDE